MTPAPPARVVVWLATMIVVSAVITGVLFLGIAILKGGTSSTLRRALRDSAPGQVLYLLEPGGVDSWMPMIVAYQRKIEKPTGDLYDVFFVDRVKFQYPPSSLLIFDLVPRSWVILGDRTIVGPFRRVHGVWSAAAVLITAVISALVLEVGLRRLPSGTHTAPTQSAARIGLSIVLGLMFFPLVTGHVVGQIQIYLNVLLGLAVLCMLWGRPAPAGVCVGVCCLVKPQYALLLLWGVLRRQWRFALGLAVVFAGGLALSIARFGVADHLRYLDVVREISRTGEAYWPNQSINGLFNRFLGNGNPVQWQASDFAQYRPVVYTLTVLSSAVVIALALWPPPRTSGTGGTLIDFMLVLAAATIASPVAWNHHYGPFLVIFAAVVPLLLSARPLGSITLPALGVGYVLVANLLVWPEVTFRSRWLGLTGSHLLFGSLVVFGILLTLRAIPRDFQESAARS